MSENENLSIEEADRQRIQYERSIRLARTQVQATAEQIIATNAAANTQISATANAINNEIITTARIRKPPKAVYRKEP